MKYITTVFKFAYFYSKRFSRDKTALFFTFFFPLLFLFVFGSLNRQDDDVSFNIALVNNSQTEFAKQFADQIKQTKTIKIETETTSIDQAKEVLQEGRVDSILELPTSFGELDAEGVPRGQVVVYYEPGSPQAGQTFSAVVQVMADQVNARLVQQNEPVSVEARSSQTTDLKTFDYLFSGLLGFSIMSMAIFGLSNSLPTEKKQGILRRLRATPLTAGQLIMGVALTYLVIGLASVALMMVAGITLFDFNMRGDYLSFAIFILLGTLTMFGFGLAIGGWAKNQNQSAPLTNIVAIPMMFLSGSFFPRFLMPDWLETISNFLPLSPIIDGLRFITTEGKTILELGPQLGLMAIWAVVIYALAIRIFRWE